MKPVLPREVALCSQRPPPAEPWVWGAPRLLASVGGAGHGNPTSCTGWPPHKLNQGHVLELSRCPSQPPEGWAIVLFVWSGLSPFTSELITMELARSASFWMKKMGCTWRQHAGVGGVSLTSLAASSIWCILLWLDLRREPFGSSVTVRVIGSSLCLSVPLCPILNLRSCPPWLCSYYSSTKQLRHLAQGQRCRLEGGCP